MLGNRNKEVMIFDMVKIMRPNQLLLFSEKLELFICFFLDQWCHSAYNSVLKACCCIAQKLAESWGKNSTNISAIPSYWYCPKLNNSSSPCSLTSSENDEGSK